VLTDQSAGGMALTSAHTMAAGLADRRVVTLDCAGLPVIRQWHVVKHADKRLLPAGRALWRFLADRGADYLPTLPNANPA
jgi:LysR family transcriptional regulator, low CO2-responsive transcriptional regulator